MNNRLEIAQEFAKEINSDKIDRIILFGSVARGDDNENSDIDILIISDYQEDIQEKVYYESFQIVLHKQEVISPHIMSNSNINKIADFTFMRNVRKEGVVIG